MTDIYSNVANSSKVAVQLAELNVKTLTNLVDNQAKLFNELLNTGLNQIKNLQNVKDVNSLVEANKNYSQDIEQKLRKAFDASTSSFEEASKKGMDILVQKNAAQSETAK